MAATIVQHSSAWPECLQADRLAEDRSFTKVRGLLADRSANMEMCQTHCCCRSLVRPAQGMWTKTIAWGEANINTVLSVGHRLKEFIHNQCCTWKTSLFWRLSGKGNSIFLSRRPGRSRAGSRVSARLVAMITFTFTVWSKPSIWFNSSIRMRCTSLNITLFSLMH